MSDAYDQDSASYAAQVREVFKPGELSDEELAAGAGALADTLGKAGDTTAGLLDAGAAAEQEAAEIRLLAQAAAQVRLAQSLLETVAEEQAGGRGVTATRAGRVSDLHLAAGQIADMLQRPLGTELQTVGRRAAAARPSDPEEAKRDLRKEVESTLRFITKEATRVGAQAVQTLLATDPEILKKGVAAISEDAAQLVDRVFAE